MIGFNALKYTYYEQSSYSFLSVLYLKGKIYIIRGVLK